MTDWRDVLESPWLRAYNLGGADHAVTIIDAKRGTVVGEGGREDVVPVLTLKEFKKPLALNRTNCKSIAAALGSNDLEEWVGKRITLYPARDRLRGETVDCIRVRATAPRAEAAIMCEVCGNAITGTGRMDAAAVVSYAIKKYGKRVCVECGRKLREMEASQ